jgi:hypothetical protein
LLAIQTLPFDVPANTPGWQNAVVGEDRIDLGCLVRIAPLSRSQLAVDDN